MFLLLLLLPEKVPTQYWAISHLCYAAMDVFIRCVNWKGMHNIFDDCSCEIMLHIWRYFYALVCSDCVSWCNRVRKWQIGDYNKWRYSAMPSWQQRCKKVPGYIRARRTGASSCEGSVQQHWSGRWTTLLLFFFRLLKQFTKRNRLHRIVI